MALSLITSHEDFSGVLILNLFYGLQNHLRSCRWRQYGYSKEEIKEIFEQEERTKNETPSSFLHIDSIVEAVAPGTIQIRSDEKYKCSLSHDQRLAIYNKSVAELYKFERKMPDQALYADLEAKAAEKLYQKENPENLSKLEMLQKIRDMKKRRQSYRAKNVHITKRSQTEIIRGVLEVHMEELRNLWNPELEGKEGKQEEKRKREERHGSCHRERSPDRDNRHQDRRSYARREASSTHHKTRWESREEEFVKYERKSSKRDMPSDSNRDRTRSHKKHKSSPSYSREKSHRRREKSSSSKEKKHKRERSEVK